MEATQPAPATCTWAGEAVGNWDAESRSVGSLGASQGIASLPASQLLLRDYCCVHMADKGLAVPGAGLLYVPAAPSAPADNGTSGALAGRAQVR